ncbi:MAG: hypothetical protein ACKPB0_16450 [Opitutaceae bacterium]
MSGSRQPWPMKWIVVAILLMAVPYTIITLRYRREGPAFQPYEDMRNRANVSRLLSAGYQRITIPAQRPAGRTGVAGGANVTTAPGGLPDDLRSTLVEMPRLPLEISTVTAASTASTLTPYQIELTCTLPDDRHQLGGAELYLRGDTLVLTPTLERVGGDLLTRARQAAVLLTIPAGTLRAGTHRVILAGERNSRVWTLEVR